MIRIDMAVLVVSYPGVHRNEIRQLVELLEDVISNVDESVFWDGDFEPGLEWFAHFQEAVRRSPKLFVMWCVDAKESAQVRREYEYALEEQKRVVPVLLDDTPLLGKLAVIHGIDLRQLFKHGRLAVDAAASRESRWVAMPSVRGPATGMPSSPPWHERLIGWLFDRLLRDVPKYRIPPNTLPDISDHTQFGSEEMRHWRTAIDEFRAELED